MKLAIGPSATCLPLTDSRAVPEAITRPGVRSEAFFSGSAVTATSM